MVVLSAAICTKNGRVLVSRQFVTMTRSRIEGLLAAFPKLLGTPGGDTQHTFIETDTVRYVYQPMEQLYMLLITNKQSNIMEDLDTLRLLAKLVPEYCLGQTEEAVRAHMFEVIFAIDEVLALGFKEQVTIQQVKTFTEMDSHEEKLQKIIMESKMNEARDEARRKADRIEKEKAEARRNMASVRFGGAPGGPSSGFGSDSMPSGMDQDDRPSKYGSGSSSGSSGGSSRTPVEDTKEIKSPTAKKPTVAAKKGTGMELKKAAAKKGDDAYATFLREEKINPLLVPQLKSGPAGKAPSSASSSAAVAAAIVEKESVQIKLEEMVVVNLEKEGAVKNMEVKGEMKLIIYDPDDSKIVVQTTGLGKEFKARLHPKINKAAWDKDGTLGLTDPRAPFPVGADSAAIVLRWRMQTNDEAMVPIALNFWPNVEDGRSVISAEFTSESHARLTLRDVRIAIPCKSSEAPEVKSIEVGDYTFDLKRGLLVWNIPEVNIDNNRGSLDFSVPELDGDSFFPINISFTSSQLFSGLQVQGVTNAEKPDKVTKYQAHTTLGVEKYIID